MSGQQQPLRTQASAGTDDMAAGGSTGSASPERQSSVQSTGAASPPPQLLTSSPRHTSVVVAAQTMPTALAQAPAAEPKEQLFTRLMMRCIIQRELIQLLDNAIFYPATTRKEDAEILALSQVGTSYYLHRYSSLYTRIAYLYVHQHESIATAPNLNAHTKGTSTPTVAVYSFN